MEMMHRCFWILPLMLVPVACGAPSEPAGDAGTSCIAHEECDDGTFCNGAELCLPVAGSNRFACAAPAAPACEAGESCNETDGVCETSCEAEDDLDGDGVASVACGGSDCDDDDASRFPGAIEFCETGNVDEDCDPSTFGVRDSDGDQYPDARCCNGTTCGGDCDDTRSGIHPDATEACNGDDDDCDGEVDEDVLRSFYPDTDGDGYGDATAAAVQGCNPPIGHVENALDCDDDAQTVNPATSELCDSLDNNCNDMIDEAGARTFYRDRDEDGFGDPDDLVSVLECTPPSGYVASGTDCNDADDTQHPGALESCNRRDDNCSQPGVERGGVDATEDFDVDGHAPIAAGCQGGLPKDDCDDIRAATRPGALEVCNDIDDDCDETRDEGGDDYCGGMSVCDVGACVANDRLAVSDGLSCLRTGGAVDCWSASQRVRGDGAPTTPSASLGRVSSLVDARQIAAAVDDYDIDDDASEFSPGYACAVRTNGRVLCWGMKDAAVGGLGDGSTTSSTTPIEVAGLTDAVDVALARTFACARRRGGGVVCWGENDVGQLGDGTTTTRATPVAVLGITDAVELAVGGNHACARLRDGTARCWGTNYHGQLADGSPFGSFDPHPTPSPVVATAGTPLTGIERIVAGQDFTCVLTAGTVRCAGDGDTVGSGVASSLVRAAVGVPTNVTWIEGSQSFGLCAGTATGANYCWGFLSNRQWLCGHGRADLSSTEPCEVAPTSHLGTFDELAIGSLAACVREGDTVRCWGENTRADRFGDGGTSLASSVVGLGQVQAHGPGCATDASGHFYQWGRITRGGDAVSIPFAVPALDGASACVVADDGVYAVVAGSLRFVPFTDGPPDPFETLPLTGSTASQLIAMEHQVWALLADGSVRTWSGASPDSTGPLASVMGASDFAVSIWSKCAVTSNTLWCAGDTDFAGTTLDGDMPDTLVEITGAGSVLRVATFPFSSYGQSTPVCVVRTDGSVACGREVVSSGSGAAPFAVVPGVEDALDVVVGLDVACALVADGAVWCWGEGLAGELGQPMRQSTMPVEVAGLTDATSISTEGRGTFCADSTSRGLVCWGRDSGWLGRGVTRAVTLLQ